MTSEWRLALGSVFLSGLLTSISPCPLATNIAAISYISRHAGKKGVTLLSGIFYVAGQTAAYTFLGYLVLSFTAFTGDRLARFLSITVHGFLGPVLILAGLIMLGWLTFPFRGTDSEKLKKTVETFGIWSAFPLGIFFALAFCPTTAAMFLAMISLSMNAGSRLLFPAVYGVGTAIPATAIALVIAFQVRWLSQMFQCLSRMDLWLRNITGTLFILIGLWFSLRNFR
jgi:cytochrome c biogenesis protein CcdA